MTQTDYKMEYNYNSTERAWEGLLVCLLNQHERKGCANQAMHASQGVFVMWQALQQMFARQWLRTAPCRWKCGVTLTLPIAARGRREAADAQPHARYVSTTDLAGTSLGEGKETLGAWFVEHLPARLGFTCCSEDLGIVQGTYIHDMLINHLTTPSHRIEC
jgi:hypothetical protein